MTLLIDADFLSISNFVGIFWFPWKMLHEENIVRDIIFRMLLLTHLQAISQFYYFWKHQKTEGFLMFVGGIEVGHRLKILIWLLTMMMMMNCFCGMVDRKKVFSLISSRDHCQRQAGFERAQSLGSGIIEWNCAVVLTTTLRRHNFYCCKYFYEKYSERVYILQTLFWKLFWTKLKSFL